MQYTGSFKLRGAYYKISQLTEEEKSRGVIACSAGNHAQGVAFGASHNGIKALICLPAGAPISKVEATKGYGAEVCLVPGVYDDAYAKAIQLRDEKGYTFVHPFDDPKVIAGQGTIGLEILEELPDVEAVIVPIGGGGLISGVAFALKTLRPDIKIYGVQSSGAPSMATSLQEGKIQHLSAVSTIADGIAVKEPGINTFEMCNQYVDEVVTVSDDEIAAAILALLEQHKIVAEGAGAVAVAAAMFNKLPIKGKKVVCLVSGGNIDVTTLSRVITRGLSKSGRNYTFKIDLYDKPGQLSGVCNIIADLGDTLSAGLGTTVDGCTFTDIHSVADTDISHFPVKFQILRNGTNHSARENGAIRSHFHIIKNRSMGQNFTTITFRYMLIYISIVTNFYILAQFGIGMYSS